VEERTSNGKKFRTLNIIDEFTRECLAIKVNRKLNSQDVCVWHYERGPDISKTAVKKGTTLITKYKVMNSVC
jgi:hypothetical protein